MGVAQCRPIVSWLNFYITHLWKFDKNTDAPQYIKSVSQIRYTKYILPNLSFTQIKCSNMMPHNQISYLYDHHRSLSSRSQLKEIGGECGGPFPEQPEQKFKQTEITYNVHLPSLKYTIHIYTFI